MTLPSKVRQRHPARKLWIKELAEGELQATQGIEPSALVTIRGDVFRVSVIGVVVAQEDMPVSTWTVEDGTGQVQVRSFERPLPALVGTMVHIIARPRTYQGTLYLAFEAAKPIDPGWAEYRKRELGEVQATQKPEPQIPTSGERENRVETLIKLIKDLDEGEGAPIEQVVLKSKFKDAEEIIEQMLLAGDIFELRPGKVKVL